MELCIVSRHCKCNYPNWWHERDFKITNLSLLPTIHSSYSHWSFHTPRLILSHSSILCCWWRQTGATPDESGFSKQHKHPTVRKNTGREKHAPTSARSGKIWGTCASYHIHTHLNLIPAASNAGAENDEDQSWKKHHIALVLSHYEESDSINCYCIGFIHCTCLQLQRLRL